VVVRVSREEVREAVNVTTVRLKQVIANLVCVDCSDVDEVGEVIDQSVGVLRELLEEEESAEQARKDALAAFQESGGLTVPTE
jgi:hypothetical protein